MRRGVGIERDGDLKGSKGFKAPANSSERTSSSGHGETRFISRPFAFDVASRFGSLIRVQERREIEIQREIRVLILLNEEIPKNESSRVGEINVERFQTKRGVSSSETSVNIIVR